MWSFDSCFIIFVSNVLSVKFFLQILDCGFLEWWVYEDTSVDWICSFQVTCFFEWWFWKLHIHIFSSTNKLVHSVLFFLPESTVQKIIILFHRCHYSPVRTFASILDFSQSALYFDLSFQFVILHWIISVGTQFHHLVFGHPLSRLPWGLLLNTWLTFFTIHSVNVTNPIQRTFSG